jgi:Arsenical pump membrane protein
VAIAGPRVSPGRFPSNVAGFLPASGSLDDNVDVLVERHKKSNQSVNGEPFQASQPHRRDSPRVRPLRAEFVRVISASLGVRTVLGLAVFFAVLALVIARPRRVNEAWPAAAGVAAFLALGLLTVRDMVGVARDTGGVLLFLAGMMIVSSVAEVAGVFTWAAAFANQASGTRRRLLVNVFLRSSRRSCRSM